MSESRDINIQTATSTRLLNIKYELCVSNSDLIEVNK